MIYGHVLFPLSNFIKRLFVVLVFILFSSSVSAQTSRQDLITNELDYVQNHLDRYRAEAYQRDLLNDQKQKLNRSEFETSFYASKPLDTSLRPVSHMDGQQLKYCNEYLNIQLEVFGGYRRDDLKWNIAGDSTGQHPNILSELKWDDLEMSQVAAKSRVTFFDFFIAEARGDYADIYDGKNQDSDYLGDDRTLEFSRSNNNSSDGEAFDVSGLFGFRIPLRPDDNLLDGDNFWITPLGGYSHHEQHLIITDGFQTIPESGGFLGLHSTYKAEWKGPFVGLELEGRKEKYTGYIRGEYHWIDYYGEANWNLRPEFSHPKSFEHIAKGDGLVFNLGAAYHITNWWLVNVEGTIQHWATDPGIDRVFLLNGTVLESQLNEVKWNSYAVMLGTTLSLF